MHDDLKPALELLFDPYGIRLTAFEKEAEGEAYAACGFCLNGFAVKFRVAKTTPEKTGQFVTLWKRKDNGPIAPFDLSDPISFVMISCREGDLRGQFIFPVQVLSEQGIIAGNNKAGKRGFRVYPPWAKTNSRQAAKTQQWQVPYFVSAAAEMSFDVALINRLFKLNDVVV